MKIIKTLQLERDDAQDVKDLRKVIEGCNMAAAFFYDDPVTGHANAGTGEGTNSINALKNGHSFELRHIERAIGEVKQALVRLEARAEKSVAPEDLLERYSDNLGEVLRILHMWKRALA